MARMSAAALAGALLIVSPASAEDDRFGRQVQDLAEILGQVHYMRSLCAEGEDMVWRDAMMELIRLEEPSQNERREMTRRFNQGYHAARDRFPECDVQARREMEKLAAEGARLSARLARELEPKRRR
jgi:uncharacterized protein (TIGR02301 family)